MGESAACAGMWTLVGPRNCLFDAGLDPNMAEAILGVSSSLKNSGTFNWALSSRVGVCAVYKVWRPCR